jgi:hypothetical protein
MEAARLLALYIAGWVNFKCQTWVSFKRSLTANAANDNITISSAPHEADLSFGHAA